MKNVYLSPEPQPYLRGDGTLWNPYDASTRNKFDRLMSGFAADTVINLLPGTFYTRGMQDDGAVRVGDWYMKSGWTIQGGGAGITKVVLDLKVADSITNGYLYALFGIRTDAEPMVGDVKISDMTLDLWVQNPETFGVKTIAYCAVNLRGTRNSVRNIEVINYGSTTTSKESFIISNAGGWKQGVPAASLTKAHNLVVENCFVHDLMYMARGGVSAMTVISCGGGGSGYSQTGWAYAPVIRNCRVYANSGTNTKFDNESNIMAIMMASCQDGIVENNVVSGCVTALYLDSHETDSLTVRNNVFLANRYTTNFKLGGELLGGSIGPTSHFKTLKRLVFENNILAMNMADYQITKQPIIWGFQLEGADTSSTAAFRLKEFIARNNMITWLKADAEAVIPAEGDESFCAFLIWSQCSGITMENNYINLRANNPANNGRPALITLEGNQKHKLYIKNNTCTVYHNPSGIVIPQDTGFYQQLYLNQA